MLRALFRLHGNPEDVIEVVEEPDPDPGTGEVRVRNQVMVINPADLLTIEGKYGSEPVTLPCTPGVGAWGIVDAVGEGVKKLAVGDAVLPVGSGGMWADTMVLHEHMAPKAPADADATQAAMMRANPATARLLLTDMTTLNAGDWVIQNAANSSVGRHVIRFARELGLHTINVVRREGLVEALNSDGADAVIVDDGNTDIAATIESITDRPPKLALDALGGAATAKLAAALDKASMVVVYGLLSGEPSQMGARELVFRDISLRGFWLSEWYSSASGDAMRELHGFLADSLAKGVITSDVQARYPLTDVKQAVAHAAQAGRNGKIILTGNA